MPVTICISDSDNDSFIDDSEDTHDFTPAYRYGDDGEDDSDSSDSDSGEEDECDTYMYATFVNANEKRGFAAAEATMFGQHVTSRVQDVVNTIGNNGVRAQADRNAALLAAARSGDLVVTRTSKCGNVTTCTACGMKRVACSIKVSLDAGETWGPVGSHCVAKVSAIADLYRHLRAARSTRNVESKAAKCRELLNKIELAI